MDSGMVVMFEVIADIDIVILKNLDTNTVGSIQRLLVGLRHTSRMLRVHARTHHPHVGDPVRKSPEPYRHFPINPERNGPQRKENGEFAERPAT